MSTETQTRPLLKVADVAERLSISESTVRRLIETGELPAHRLGAGPQPPVRADPEALEAWLDQRLASVSGPAASGTTSPIAGSPRGGLEGEAALSSASTSKRGYGWKHQKLRNRWARDVARGEVECARCGEPIWPEEPWDLGHVDGDMTRYSGPEHRAWMYLRPGRSSFSQVAKRGWAVMPTFA